MKLTITLSVALVAAAGPALALGQPPEGTFRGLGDLGGGGGYISQAHAISADGSTIVGGASSPVGREAFLWRNGVMADLHDLPGGEDYGDARAISADGSIIYGVGRDGPYDRVFRWENGVMARIDAIPTADRWVLEKMGCSADGSTLVGQSLESVPGSHYEAYRYAGGVRSLMGTGPGFYSDAAAASGDGSVIVGNTLLGPNHNQRPLIWQNGAVAVLSNMPDAYVDSASDISADGRVVTGSAAGQAYRWENGQCTLLGAVPGAAWSWSLAISADGSTVVGTDEPLNRSAAFVWDAAHGIRRIEQVMHEDFGLNMSGWRLFEATDVSADGRTIIGNGYDPQGREEAWVAVIPSPAGVGTLVVAAVLQCVRRRRPRRGLDAARSSG